MINKQNLPNSQQPITEQHTCSQDLICAHELCSHCITGFCQFCDRGDHASHQQYMIPKQVYLNQINKIWATSRIPALSSHQIQLLEMINLLKTSVVNNFDNLIRLMTKFCPETEVYPTLQELKFGQIAIDNLSPQSYAQLQKFFRYDPIQKILYTENPLNFQSSDPFKMVLDFKALISKMHNELSSIAINLNLPLDEIRNSFLSETQQKEPNNFNIRISQTGINIREKIESSSATRNSQSNQQSQPKAVEKPRVLDAQIHAPISGAKRKFNEFQMSHNTDKGLLTDDYFLSKKQSEPDDSISIILKQQNPNRQIANKESKLPMNQNHQGNVKINKKQIKNEFVDNQQYNFNERRLTRSLNPEYVPSQQIEPPVQIFQHRASNKPNLNVESEIELFRLPPNSVRKVTGTKKKSFQMQRTCGFIKRKSNA